MASIKLKGDTSGEVTISAPSVAGTTTLELPATSSTLATQNSLGVRNLIINGNFDIWQRGTSHSITSSQYTVDRWQLIFDGTPASGGTVTRQTFTLGQTDVPNNPKYYLQYDFPNVGTPSNYIRQSIEGVHNLAGQTATFSFWAKVPSGTMTISTQFQQEFGSGGSPSSGVYGIGSTNFTVTTSWQKFTMTTTLPSISGKAVGTNNNDKLNAAIIFSPSTAGTIHLAQAQVEAGDTATPFEVRPYDMELQRCERYFEMSYSQGTALGTVTQNGAEMWLANRNPGTPHHYLKFRTVKRANPTITIYNPTTGATGSFRNIDAGTNPSAVISRTGHKGSTIYTTTSTGLGQFMQFHYTADVEL